MTDSFAITGGRIFDGQRFLDSQALVINDGQIEAIETMAMLPPRIKCFDAAGKMVVPGFVDLQVNGGGGVLFNNDRTVEGIAAICASHARFGTTSVMVTLITDTVGVWKESIAAGAQAAEQGVKGYLGLHLEGPHLSLARKGTHDPALIRPMDHADLAALTSAAGSFGKCLTTVAPENVTPGQVRALCDAGYVVSLGHTDTDAVTVKVYIDAGVTMVTHLFNAMRQMGNREPGVVGAALDSGVVSCGLIADGFHVDPVMMGIALRAKRGPGPVFLVTDAMSTIGTDEKSFELNGRTVYRQNGRLMLADGTLAGADIDMLSSVRFVHYTLGVPLADALNMASLYPAKAINAQNKGKLSPGFAADFLLLDDRLNLSSTWIAGQCVHQA